MTFQTSGLYKTAAPERERERNTILPVPPCETTIVAVVQPMKTIKYSQICHSGMKSYADNAGGSVNTPLDITCSVVLFKYWTIIREGGWRTGAQRQWTLSKLWKDSDKTHSGRGPSDPNFGFILTAEQYQRCHGRPAGAARPGSRWSSSSWQPSGCPPTPRRYWRNGRH